MAGKIVVFVLLFTCVISLTTSSSSSSSSLSSQSRRSIRNRKLRQLSSGITRCNNQNVMNEANKALLEKHLKQSEFVFTGKVTSEFDIDRDFGNVNAIYGKHQRVRGDFRGFLVRVKRVLKGDVYGASRSGHVQVLVGNGSDGDNDKYSHVCYTIIRVHHTAIFLAQRSTYVDNSTISISMETTADPLPITLRNLDLVNAFVKDMTYRPRLPLLEEPCEKKYCPWGSLCVADSDEAAHCECPSECPADPSGPVCGTDDITYETQCLLRRKACREQDNTRVRHSGACGDSKRRHH